MSNSVAISIHY